MKQTKIVMTVILIVAVIAGIFFLKNQPTQVVVVEKQNRRIKGPDDAELKIVKYVDFECPACAHGTMYLKSLMQRYPDLIQLEFKYFPFASHQHSMTASRYAQCAWEQDQFWPFQENVFATQAKWRPMANVTEFFDEIATKLNLNLAQLHSCIDKPEIKEMIEKDKANGVELKIRSTPSYFVNGELVVGTRDLRTKIAPHIPKTPATTTGN